MSERDDPELEKLREVDGGPVEMAPVAPPADLLERTLARIEREGLLTGAGDVPAGLFDKTMARLEEEGLVRPEAPARSRAWRAAAAILLAAGLGALGGYVARGREVVREVVTVDRPVEREKVVVREKVVEVPVERVVEKIVERPVEVEKVVERVVVVPAPAPAPAAAADSAVVASAAGVERWEGRFGRWRAIQAGRALEPGSVLRAAAIRSEAVLGGRRFALGDGLYVLTAAGALEPVPSGGPTLAAAVSPPPAPARALSDEERVPALLQRVASGSPDVRAAAERDLLEVWRRRGDPGPGVLAAIGDFATRGPRGGDNAGELDPSRPPASAQAWESWWARVVR